MQDLYYIFSLGFSGSDFVRALWIGLVASLLATRRFRPWKVVIIALTIDLIWPFYAMSLYGYETDVIVASIGTTLNNIPQDMAYYLIRYIGFLGLVYLGYNLRRFVHGYEPPDVHKKKKTVYPY